jgi:hypothetical protein
LNNLSEALEKQGSFGPAFYFSVSLFIAGLLLVDVYGDILEYFRILPIILYGSIKKENSSTNLFSATYIRYF